MIQRFRIGNNLAITWLLYEEDGNIHNLEGKEIELYMTCGSYKYPVTSYTVTENAVAWTFPAGVQTKTGYYKLVLLERDSVRGLYSFDVAEAFCLEPKDALTNIETIIDEDAPVQVRSVLTYAHITNLASVDTVETNDGYNAVIHLTNGKSFAIPVGNGGSGGGSVTPSISIVDNLNSNNPGAALSAKQGRILREMIEAAGGGADVVDNLNSTSQTSALSANMGRTLKALIDEIQPGSGSVTIVDNLTEGGRTKALSAEQGKALKALIDALDPSSDVPYTVQVVDAMYSAVDANPGTPSTNDSAWHSTRGVNDVWIALRFKVDTDWGPWSVIRIDDYETVYASYKSFVFKRSNSQPDAPSASSGSYASPVPTGWSDGIPSGTGAVWMSTRTFSSDGEHDDVAWATPRLVADNNYWDYEFSTAENPGTPAKTGPTATETNPNWSNNATSSTIWMAMREVDNGAYKSGSSWAVVKIKGEDGQDGTSVSILGSVASVGDLPSSDNTAGDGYLVDGNLYVWDGDSWEDCGTIQGPAGEDGATPYIHIKYSNDGSTFTSNSGEDPGDYIGIYWDYTATDSSTFSDYTWKEWKGQDGFGYEYIFKTTATGTAPSLPSSSPNTDDYVPTGWTDDPGLDDPNNPFCWVAWRKKEDGVWSAWHGTTNNKARLYAYWAKDGAAGTNGVDGKDAKPLRIRNWSDVYNVTLTGNQKVFSGYGDDDPFRDVLIITKDDYPNNETYPFTSSYGNDPVLLVVNYSSSYPNGYSGTNIASLGRPSAGHYSTTVPANKTSSQSSYSGGVYYCVFANFGAVYAAILVATQGYIRNLTVNDLLANNSVVSRSFNAQDITVSGGSIGGFSVSSSGLSSENVEVISQGTGAKRSSEFAINASGLSFENWYGPTTSHLEGEFSVATNDTTRDGFVEINATKTGAYTNGNGGFDAALYVSSNNSSIPAISADGNVVVDGNLSLTDGGTASFCVATQIASSEGTTVTTSDSGLLLFVNTDSQTISLPVDPANGFTFTVICKNACTITCSSPAQIYSIVDGNVNTGLSSVTPAAGYSWKLVYFSTAKYWIITKG